MNDNVNPAKSPELQAVEEKQRDARRMIADAMGAFIMCATDRTALPFETRKHRLNIVKAVNAWCDSVEELAAVGEKIASKPQEH